MFYISNSIFKIIKPEDNSVTGKKCFMKENLCQIRDECISMNISACTSFDYNLLRKFNDLIFNLTYRYSYNLFYKKVVKDICKSTYSTNLTGWYISSYVYDYNSQKKINNYKYFRHSNEIS